ncbi:MAG: PHP domain-containing protein [Acidimicrobiales bacterium]
MLDYHLHLWPHELSETTLSSERIAAYWKAAQAAGVHEIAVTEHLFRFGQSRRIARNLFDGEPAELVASMVEYFDHHARADLDGYVEAVLAAKAAGVPVALGLEVDHYRGRMDDVAKLLGGYPFDVLLGSVHWLGAWRFDDLGEPAQMERWSDAWIEEVWDRYATEVEAMAASGCCDVLAHLDLAKVAGHIPPRPEAFWDRLAGAASNRGLAVEISSAGLFKWCQEVYPAPGLLDRLVARGVSFTTASDAHDLERVGQGMDILRGVLKRAGIERLVGYTARAQRPVPLKAAADH